MTCLAHTLTILTCSLVVDFLCGPARQGRRDGPPRKSPPRPQVTISNRSRLRENCLHVQDVARHPDPAYCCHLYGHYWKILILYAMNCKAMRTWLYNVIFIHIVINTSPLSRLPKIEYFLPTVLSLEIGDKKRVFWPSLACQYSAYFGLRLRSAVSSWFCGVATHLLVGTLVERWREIPAMEILADQVCLFCDLIVNKVNLIIPDQGKLRKEARKAASSHRISSRVVE